MTWGTVTAHILSHRLGIFSPKTMLFFPCGKIFFAIAANQFRGHLSNSPFYLEIIL